MSRLKNSLLAASGFGILVGGMLLTNPPPSDAIPGVHDVLVVNPLAQPVPTRAQGTTTISGNVNVANTPTVNFAPGASVNVANTPAVTFAPGASVGLDPAHNTVQVGNTTANPVPVFNVNGGFQPFQAGANSTQSGFNVSTADIATVPAGFRLVIDFVTATGQVPPTQHVEILQITTSTDPFGGLTHDLLINAQPDAVIGDALFRASQMVKLYANPGTTVQALFRRNASAGNATFSMTISGHLEPVS